MDKIFDKIIKNPFKALIYAIIISLSGAIAVYIFYNIGEKYFIIFYTNLEIGDALSFYGAFLSFLGSIVLGGIAIWQNREVHKLNEDMNYNQKLNELPLIDLKRFEENSNNSCVYLWWLDTENKYSLRVYISNDTQYLVSNIKLCSVNLYSSKDEYILNQDEGYMDQRALLPNNSAHFQVELSKNNINEYKYSEYFRNIEDSGVVIDYVHKESEKYIKHFVLEIVFEIHNKFGQIIEETIWYHFVRRKEQVDVDYKYDMWNKRITYNIRK